MSVWPDLSHPSGRVAIVLLLLARCAERGGHGAVQRPGCKEAAVARALAPNTPPSPCLDGCHRAVNRSEFDTPVLHQVVPCPRCPFLDLPAPCTAGLVQEVGDSCPSSCLSTLPSLLCVTPCAALA